MSGALFFLRKKINLQSQSWLGTLTCVLSLLLSVNVSLAAPTTPQATLPGNGATNVPPYPTLEINCNTAETAAAQYVIASDAAFSSIVYDSLETTNDVCSHFAFAGLTPGTQYFWQARIKNAQGEWSEWSSSADFTTETQPSFLNVFQDGTAGYSGTRDADMRGSAQNPMVALYEWDQGAQNVLRTGRRRPGAAEDEIYRSLIRFDLSALTDPTAVQNVYLEMTGFQHGQIAEWFPGHERLNSLYEVIRPWTEGNDIKDSIVGTGEVSWTYSEKPTKWSIPGAADANDNDPNADRKATSLVKFVTTNEIGYRTYWSSKALVDTIKGWIANPSMNKGLFFQADNESIQKAVMLASREHENQTYHPRLVIISTEQALLGLNQPPVAGRDTAVTIQNVSVYIPVLGNDIDQDDAPSPLFVQSVDDPPHGSASIVADEILYVPDIGYSGWDRFTYTISDGQDQSVGVVIVQIEAPLPPVTFPLTVTFPGAGDGTVSSNPSGLFCAATCTIEFPENTPIILTANPMAGMAFDGWSGAGCSGTGTCTVTLSQADSVAASFSQVPSPATDTEPPVISLTYPANGDTLTGASLIIANPTDNLGVAGVQLLVDGAAIGPEVISAPWTILWDSTTVTPGTHTLSAQARDVAGNIGMATDIVVIVETPTGFLQNDGADGLVVFEAEHYHHNTARNNHSWDAVSPVDASNILSLQVSPNIDTNQKSAYSTNSPQLDYLIKFTHPGVHYVWIRGLGPSDRDDSVHVGLNGQELNSSNAITGFASSLSWSRQTMDGTVATINVPTAGEHTLNVWMREDGFIIDKIMLTTNPTYPPPTGHGPAESPQGSPPAPDTEPPVVTITSPQNDQVLSGAITFQAAATDNKEVVGVQFLLNGSNLGSEVTTAPWTKIWDSTTVVPGAYFISAQARDAAGNTALATEISITIETPPAPVFYSLTTTLTGGGSGTVHSDIPGLNCPGTCTADFLKDTHITLTANPAVGSIFDGWNGAGCSGTGTCNILMSQAMTVEAGFSIPPPPPLDTQPPVIGMDAPTEGQTIAGTVSVRATATDNVKVTGVQFLLNGGTLGTELTTSPWIMSWDSSSVEPGVYTLSAQARDAAGNTALAPEITVTVESPQPAGFLQSDGPDGLVVVEAEHYHHNTAQGNHSWDIGYSVDASNGSGLTANPNIDTNQNTNYATNSPQLDYTIQFTRTGVHYVWIRGFGPTDRDDSLHVGLDGQALSSSDRITGFGPAWTWSNQTMDGNSVAAINVSSPGEHTLNVWMREDGFMIDKIILTINPNYPTPAGYGPGESSQGPPPPDLTAPTVTITAPADGATVSGTITVTAAANDSGSGVAGVQFFLEGAPIGAEITSPPYALDWDTTTVSPDLPYALSAEVRDMAGNIGTTALPTMVQVVVPGLMRQQDGGSDGLISVEAEHFQNSVSMDFYSWIPTNQAGFSGESAMVTFPNNGLNMKSNYETTGPRLDFEVNFTHVGTHYVWIRGIGPSQEDDSVHIGLDGKALSSSDKMSGISTNWTWSNETMDGPVATIQVTTPGPHTINLWMREDGAIIDKLVLTVNPAYIPSGTGPVESPMQ